MEKKKKNYVIPSMEVVVMEPQGSLLAGSEKFSNDTTPPDIDTDGFDGYE